MRYKPLEEVGCVTAVEGDEAPGGEGCEGRGVGGAGIDGIGGFMAIMGAGRGSEVARETLEGMAGF